MSTFLQLVQQLQREAGIAGTAVSAVTSQTGIYEKLVNWVADADIHIQSMRVDWKFLWSEYSVSTTIGNALPASPSDLGIWDKESFYLDYSLSTNRSLKYLDYLEWKKGRGRGVLTNRKPERISIKPDNQLILVNPPDAAYALTGEYWKTPTRLAANSDTSDIPVQFERVIITQAKIWLAEEQEIPYMRDEAIRELNGYGDDEGLMSRLKAHELVGNEGRIMGNAPDITVVPA